MGAWALGALTEKAGFRPIGPCHLRPDLGAGLTVWYGTMMVVMMLRDDDYANENTMEAELPRSQMLAMGTKHM